MAKVKNPFKKGNVTDTIVNIGIGGAGNVVFDTIWNYLPANMTSAVSATVKSAVKLVGGAVLGGMTSNKYLRAMADGFGVVGASELVDNLISGTLNEGSGDETSKGGDETSKGSNGLPTGTIGRIRRPQYGSKAYARKRGTSGLDGFMD